VDNTALIVLETITTDLKQKSRRDWTLRHKSKREQANGKKKVKVRTVLFPRSRSSVILTMISKRLSKTLPVMLLKNSTMIWHGKRESINRMVVMLGDYQEM